MKKMMYFLIAVLVLLNIGYYAYDYQKSKAASNAAVVDQIDLKTLQSKLENKEDVTVFFFQPDCFPCQLASPLIEEVSKELKIEIVKLNIKELPEAWETFNISGTPTIKHFEKGEAGATIVGKKSKEEYIKFFENLLSLE